MVRAWKVDNVKMYVGESIYAVGKIMSLFKDTSPCRLEQIKI